MGILIGRYNFAGPYGSVSGLEDRSGVYVILADNGSGYNVVDVGESATVKSRVETHDRAECWRLHATGRLSVAALYTPGLQQASRCAIERELRQQYDPPCGKR
jgi:hypothetical protein